jgi:hypothetical protein
VTGLTTDFDGILYLGADVEICLESLVSVRVVDAQIEMCLFSQKLIIMHKICV